MTAFQPRLVALLRGSALHSPAVGLWRDAPAAGTVITPGSWLGDLEILGIRHRLEAPPTAHGMIAQLAATTARHPVAYDEVLLTLTAAAGTMHAAGPVAAQAAAATSAAALVIRAPTSGRIYLRPSPDKPPFVTPGTVLTPGTTLCLLEVMKTFNRVTYGGPGLPESATLVTVLRQNEDDVDANAPLFELAPIL
jgi:acetyl-CoA carboxylase biotin carboxyl carrier protein